MLSLVCHSKRLLLTHLYAAETSSKRIKPCSGQLWGRGLHSPCWSSQGVFDVKSWIREIAPMEISKAVQLYTSPFKLAPKATILTSARPIDAPVEVLVVTATLTKIIARNATIMSNVRVSHSWAQYRRYRETAGPSLAEYHFERRMMASSQTREHCSTLEVFPWNELREAPELEFQGCEVVVMFWDSNFVPSTEGQSGPAQSRRCTWNYTNWQLTRRYIRRKPS